MIRVSTRGRYALRAMVDLALHSGEAPVLRQDIAERQDISADYVAQLFRQPFSVKPEMGKSFKAIFPAPAAAGWAQRPAGR